jgi:peptidase E
VLAIGGFSAPAADQAGPPRLVEHALELAGRQRPRVCVLNTAMGDDPGTFLRMYSWLSGVSAQASHLQLFPMPNVADPGDLLLSQDVIFVGGGSVANMLAVWRVHGLDQVMRTAWRNGVVLAGVSAGALCWFEGGTTDSFGVELRPFTAGLALLTGSYCPHYSSEPRRRPLYEWLVADSSLSAGIACDDGTAAHFADDELAEIVAEQPGQHGYRVEQDGAGGAAETMLATRLLP